MERVRTIKALKKQTANIQRIPFYTGPVIVHLNCIPI